MDLTAVQDDLCSAYVRSVDELAGDRRTQRLVGETIRGSIGAERRCGARIAAFSPVTAIAATQPVWAYIQGAPPEPQPGGQRTVS